MVDKMFWFVCGACAGAMLMNTLWYLIVRRMIKSFYDEQRHTLNSFYATLKQHSGDFYETLKRHWNFTKGGNDA